MSETMRDEDSLMTLEEIEELIKSLPEVIRQLEEEDIEYEKFK